MRSSTACGADGLCVRFVKLCLSSLCHVLTHIVNTSLVSNCVPSSWKLTFVQPIQKSAKSTDISNYRPISILPTIAMITERVVYEQFFYYFSVVRTQRGPSACAEKQSFSTLLFISYIRRPVGTHGRQRGLRRAQTCGLSVRKDSCARRRGSRSAIGTRCSLQIMGASTSWS